MHAVLQLTLPTRSTNMSFIKLTSQNDISPQKVFETLCHQTVELVFTAHPTQAFRQSLLKKYAKVRTVQQMLLQLRCLGGFCCVDKCPLIQDVCFHVPCTRCRCGLVL